MTAEPSTLFRDGVSDGALLSSVSYVNPGRSIYQSRSYWIPGSYVPIWSEKHYSFLWLLKNKGFKEGRVTKIKLYALGASKTLESNKSLF